MFAAPERSRRQEAVLRTTRPGSGSGSRQVPAEASLWSATQRGPDPRIHFCARRRTGGSCVKSFNAFVADAARANLQLDVSPRVDAASIDADAMFHTPLL